MPTKPRHSIKKGECVRDYLIESVVSRSHSGITYRVVNSGNGSKRLLREYFPTELAKRDKDGLTVTPGQDDEAQYESGLADFLEQSRALAAIRDPYIERIEEILQANNTAYQVIEFDEGMSLDAHMRTTGIPLPAAETEKIFRELLRGLATLHIADIFHRDLKARNVYVREDGPCMLTGFGNAVTESGFPSAETAQGDLAALAVLIYKCATGSRQRPSRKSVAVRLEQTELTQQVKDLLGELLNPAKCKQYTGADEVLRRFPDEETAPRHTRTEIERSVRTPISASPKAKRQQPVSAFESDSSESGRDKTRSAHRETRIIGGRISGVSRRPRPGGRAGWWILGTIVVLVSLAFLLPTPRNNQPEPGVADATGSPPPERTDIYATSRVDEETEDNTLRTVETTFVRPDDEVRANEYRLAELEEAKIEELLQSASGHIDELRYTEPPGENALEDYRAVLALNPSNARAVEGTVFIMDRLVESGIRMLGRDEVTRAGQMVARIRQIEVDSPQADQLESSIAAWHTEQELRRENERKEAIAEFLATAEAAVNDDRLISPTRDNALYYYRQLLEFDPGNEQGEIGVGNISQHYLGLANESILENDLGAAEGFLTTVEVIQPENPAIALLREQISVRKRQEAMGLAQPSTEPPVAVQSDTVVTAESTGPVDDDPLLPRQPPADSNTPVADVVDIEVEASTAGSSVVTNDERQLQSGLDAYYQGRYEEAYEYLTPLSYRGIARAQFRVGIMYQLGRGVTRDTERAREIIGGALPAIRRFAENGRAWAQADLGSLYEDGIVVARDYNEAIKWYTAAAIQGYAGAQTNLGVMYALGRGVERDRDEAIRWLQQAADQGDRVATENLKTLGIR